MTNSTPPPPQPSFKQQRLNNPLQKSLNIISFPPYYPPHLGGLEKFAADLDHQFATNGHRITIFTANIAPSYSGHRDSKITTVVRYPAVDIIFGFPIPKFWAPQFWRLFSSLYKTKPDVVLSSTRFFISSLLALIYSKTTNSPWLHIEHGSDYVKSNNILISLIARIYDETLGRLVLNLSTTNIAPSLSARHFINKFDKKVCPVIYRGVVKEEIDAIIPDPSISSLYPNKIIITFAGRFIDGKGIPDLIKALSKIKHDKYAALLIGSGPTKDKILQLTKKYKITNQILFLDHKTHVETIALLKASHIFVNPSYNEGLPTTLLEASLSGCAILATDVGGTPEIITHNKSGILYTPKDISSLTKHLTNLISNSKLRLELSKQAKKSVITKFNWDNTYKQYMRAINKIS